MWLQNNGRLFEEALPELLGNIVNISMEVKKK